MAIGGKGGEGLEGRASEGGVQWVARDVCG